MSSKTAIRNWVDPPLFAPPPLNFTGGASKSVACVRARAGGSPPVGVHFLGHATGARADHENVVLKLGELANHLTPGDGPQREQRSAENAEDWLSNAPTMVTFHCFKQGGTPVVSRLDIPGPTRVIRPQQQMQNSRFQM